MPGLQRQRRARTSADRIAHDGRCAAGEVDLAMSDPLRRRAPWQKRRDRRFGRRISDIRKRADQYTEWEAEGRATLERRELDDPGTEAA